MFGYIRPHKPEMLVKEYELFKSAYCSLCRHLGKQFGLISRLTLSYDATFLAMVALALKPACPGVKAGRCVVNPLKKCAFCTGGEESFAFAGAVSVCMTYYKIKDDIADSGFFGKLRSYMLLPFAAYSFRKARKKFPRVEAIVARCMDKQAKEEHNPEAGIDSSAEPTAQMLSDVLLLLSDGSSSQNLILTQFGYFIGRWIYLMDAADDIDKDQKRGNFNPFVKRLITERETPMEEKERREYCNGVLNQTLSQALNAFRLLELHHFDGILKNTMELGLPAMQKKILFDKEIEHV